MSDNGAPVTGDAAATGASANRGANHSAQPMFYASPEALDPKRHGALGLSRAAGFAFAAGTNAIPLLMSEFTTAARNFPIVLSGDAPVAVLSLKSGENLFVDAAGAWEPGAYIPAYARRYPFIFADDKANNRLVLCVDRAAPMVVESPDAPFFNGEEATEVVDGAMQLCTMFHRDHQTTQRFVAMLREHDLLVGQRADISLNDGEKLAVGDYQSINPERIDGLSDEAFLALRRSNALPWIYAMIASQQNWRDLARRTAEMRAARAANDGALV